ncbi:hypothetical protein GCM10018781_28290 [Kitasatospora indigofera]|uniref:Uncharacterized protein n=1 Tax=Kitasatospora indigofera TaxID=67307 RepID=A0A919KQQ0_9ACTN|nr:hypothetical protein GCM10018781_28290 [Kitasatospora indigofera]
MIPTPIGFSDRTSSASGDSDVFTMRSLFSVCGRAQEIRTRWAGSVRAGRRVMPRTGVKHTVVSQVP